MKTIFGENITYKRNQLVINGYTDLNNEEVPGLTQKQSPLTTVPDLLVAVARAKYEETC